MDRKVPIRPYTAESMDLPISIGPAYDDLANDPRYQHFVRIPDRIIQCIDYFGIACDHAAVRAKLHTYYLFIGIVDDAIDSGRIDTGKLILDYLSSPAPDFNEEVRRSSVRLMTELLKFHMTDRTYPVMMDRLRRLYEEVINERAASSIDSYIGRRESVGALTAELSFLLIRPGLSDDNERLCELMKQVGAIGCLIDSLIDLNKDRRLGLLAFHPGMMDYAKLIASILRKGVRVSFKHPRLYGLFFRAVIDNMRDPFRAERTFPRTPFTSDRKDEAASVA
jgi:hypothetical protein